MPAPTERKKPAPMLVSATLSGSVITVRALPVLRDGKQWAGGAVLFCTYAGDCFGIDRLTAWLNRNRNLKLDHAIGFSYLPEEAA